MAGRAVEGEARRLMIYWPVGIAVALAVGASVRADTTLANHESRISQLEMANAEISQRLARIEQTTADSNARTARIEQKLDRLPQ